MEELAAVSPPAVEQEDPEAAEEKAPRPKVVMVRFSAEAAVVTTTKTTPAVTEVPTEEAVEAADHRTANHMVRTEGMVAHTAAEVAVATVMVLGEAVALAVLTAVTAAQREITATLEQIP